MLEQDLNNDVIVADTELVLFDLGGVLCRFMPEIRLEALAEAGHGLPSTIDERLWGSGFSDACDRGEHSLEEMFDEIRERIDVDLTDAHLMGLWSLAFEPNLSMLAHAEALGSDCRVGLFTNNSPVLEAAMPGFLPEVADRVRESYFSYALGVEKPSLQAFQRVERRAGVSGSAIVFFDDSEINVQSARAAGWRAYLARDHASVAATLRALGLLE